MAEGQCGCGVAASDPDLGYARPDLQRASRQGVGEVVYGEGKTAEQIAGIVRALVAGGQEHVLITRLDDRKAADVSALLCAQGAVGEQGATGDMQAMAGVQCDAKAAAGAQYDAKAVAGAQCDTQATVGVPGGDGLTADVPGGAPVDMSASAYGDARGATNGGFSTLELDYRADARLGMVGGMPAPDGNGRVVVAAAGTSDLGVAEEAACTAEFLGNEVVRLYDVGVAGVHRLLSCMDDLAAAHVVIAVAGMEGALPSVVGGLVSCPVIAVPTSVGYGASFGGIAALLAMLNSCASGVSVVNIDNGFGAGYQASLINHLPEGPRA